MKKRFATALVLILSLVTACQPAPPVATTQPAQVPANQYMLELVGPQGSKSLSLDEIKKLPATQGQAGIKSSTGKITPPSAHKGVPLTDLVKLVGELGTDIGVEVEAKDGYAMTLSADQITKGDFIAYDPVSGKETKAAGTLQVLIAYENEGKAFDVEKDGQLKLVIISDKPDQVTDGHWAVKWVRKITVKPVTPDEITVKTVAPPALVITGLVAKPLSLSMDDVKKLDLVNLTVEHPSKGKQDVQGVRLNALLDMAQLKAEAKTLVITAKDGFTAELGLADVRACKDCLVAFNEIGGLNTSMPGMPGNLWIKDPVKLEAK